MCLSWQKHVFCRDKSMLVTAKVLSWQTYFCRHKTFVATNICHDKHNVVMTKVRLSWQNFCRDKHIFVATKYLWQQTQFYLDESFVATSLLLLQQNKSFVTTKVCLSGQNFSCDKCMFVTTNIILSWQNLSQQAYFCCDKDVFVVTKLLSGQKWYLWQLSPMTEVCNKGTKARTVHWLWLWPIDCVTLYVCIYVYVGICFNCILLLYFLMGCVLRRNSTQNLKYITVNNHHHNRHGELSKL